MFEVYWTDQWLEEEDEPRGAAVKLTTAPEPTLKAAAQAALALGPAAVYRHGPGEIVTLDGEGRCVGAYIPYEDNEDSPHLRMMS